jgi:glycosyltransferase involved in cell wall biosynthesis
MVGSPHFDGLDLLNEARVRGLDSCVHWLGCLPPERMPDLYCAVDAFVCASHNEGLSNSMLEAMATGLPIVVTDVGGHAEIVADGVNGQLVPSREVDKLAAALEEVLTNRESSARLGRAARQRALEIGTPHTNAAHLLSYFQELLPESKRSRSSEDKIRPSAESSAF